ncbi:MAG: SagB/ThcOx family dehydrogenase [Chloroflexota bacterium]|nr:SagB/ThcOx family dehydrogenase [Chloroflexota bacterium]MDE2969791.1 SagB/ThcOx family dehydrogenase [Chloroflexota bacterium]
MNSDEAVQAILSYHEKTNHSVRSVREGNFALDFSILPRLYKLYRRAQTVALPEDAALPDDGAPSTVPALAAIAGEAAATDGAPSLDDVTALLKLSAGITKWLKVPNGRMAFRAASCTGALYHIELYLVCGDLPGLPAGVYQYGAHDNALRIVRAGDHRGALVAATGGDEAVAAAPASIVYTSVFWRNAWKYQSRAYRHTYWDCGTVLANTLAVAGSRGLRARVVTGFVDDSVNRLVDVDGVKEASVAVVPVGAGAGAVQPEAAPARLNLETLPYSPKEIDYPLIREAHAATSLDEEGVVAWRAQGAASPFDFPQGERVDGETAESVERVILRRGSTRQFQLAPIGEDALRTTLAAAMRPLPGDWPSLDGAPVNTLYLIVNAVDGLQPGGYVYHPEDSELELLMDGDQRFIAGHLGLNQALAHDAAANCYFLTDLGAATAAMGARGYRAAQLDASVRAGRLYLSAYAMGLGATGLTFFDDEVTQFFSPHAAGKSVMFLTLLGVPQKRRRVMPE